MPTIDELGAGAAARLLDEMRAGIDVEARLAAIRASDTTISAVSRRVSPRVWGAAASVAIIAVGAVGLSTLRHGGAAVSPSSTTTEAAPATTTPATTTLATESLDPIAASYASPPPVFTPRVFATVSSEAQIGLTETGAVVALQGSAYTVDWDGMWSEVTSIPWNLSDPVVYEGVVYGLAQTSLGPDSLVMVAAALRPDPAGVLSTTPVAAAAYVELPFAPFGLGRDGIVDRVRDAGSTLVPYAAYGGSPRVFDGAASATIDDSLVVTSSSGQRWQLAIERDPGAAVDTTANEDLRPLPGVDGSVVVVTSLGSLENATDGAQSVIAELDADGGGRWWSLPDGWTLAASDVFGTILQRRTDTGIDLARFPMGQGTSTAMFDPAITEVDVAPRSFPLEITGCDPQQEQYCQVESLRDDRLIVYRPSTGSFVVLGADGTEQEHRLDPPFTGAMIAVGPDDIVYLASFTEQDNDIATYRLDGGVATRIAMVRGVTDMSGDTDIVATRIGLVSVGCCGGPSVRPDPAREPLMRWVDRSGANVVDERPFIRVEDVDGGVVFVRQDPDGTTTRWPSSGAITATIRGMPSAAPLADGGAIVGYYDQAGGTGFTFLRLGPSGSIERTISADLTGYPTRSGRLFASSADQLVEIQLAGFSAG